MEITRISEQCNKLREQADEKSQTRVELKTMDFESILSYNPQEKTVKIFVIPLDYQFSTGKQIITEISDELGEQYKGIKSSDSGNIVEFTTDIDWSHN